jgi:hypothetical protein
VRRTEALATERADYIVDFLSRRSCADCGEFDPRVLEFDHLRDKKFDITRGLRQRPWAALLDEIAKCDVVCANCHRRRTALRAGTARLAALQRRSVTLSEAELPLDA